MVLLADLNVEEEQRVSLFRPAVHFLDERRVHAKAIHAVSAGSALRDDGDQLQCRLDGCRGIGALPVAHRVVELGEHLIGRVLAQTRPCASRADCRRTPRCDWRGESIPTSGVGAAGQVFIWCRPKATVDAKEAESCFLRPEMRRARAESPSIEGDAACVGDCEAAADARTAAMSPDQAI